MHLDRQFVHVTLILNFFYMEFIFFFLLLLLETFKVLYLMMTEILLIQEFETGWLSIVVSF